MPNAITPIASAQETKPVPTVFSLETALLTLRDQSEIERFLFDLCTPTEIASFRERWTIAQLLEQGKTYRDVAGQTGASTATVTRVARFLQHERHCGYRLALDRLREKNQ